MCECMCECACEHMSICVSMHISVCVCAPAHACVGAHMHKRGTESEAGVDRRRCGAPLGLHEGPLVLVVGI